IAPGQYSIDDPEAAKIIYGLGKGFNKTAWYKASADPNAIFHDLFTDRNTVRHSVNRRLVANLYSASALTGMETNVDECIALLVGHLNELAGSKKIFDLVFWMQCYAFDAIGHITVGKRFGFLDRGTDDDNIFSSLGMYLKYCANIGILHEIHDPLSWLMARLSSSSINHVGNFTQNQIKEGKKEFSAKAGGPKKQDFLSKILQLHNENPERFPETAIYTTCITNIGAGSDTTSISICSILFNLMNTPTALLKLRQEIDEKLPQLEKTNTVTFKDAQSMPYLQACIKEGLRLHPATGLPLGRIVPEGGVSIQGTYFPAGTTVGINTWVAHMNQNVFGPDPEAFRPERWVDESKEKLSLMDSYWMPFGGGSRTCIGKNISLLEINKLVPVLVKNFDFVAHEPEKVTHDNAWLVKQQNMRCSVSQRK
ncbi:cytochrome P450, partial [Ilyonectria destructans]